MSHTTLVGIIECEKNRTGNLVVKDHTGLTVDKTLQGDEAIIAEARVYELQAMVLRAKAAVLRTGLISDPAIRRARLAEEATKILAEQAEDFWDKWSADDVISGVEDILGGDDE